ncbi:MAG: hypothetical protein J6Z49_10365 [Kiritimatiellae bacterium]|nr:hypothetical protein [Kiritimatiellia bacterium]
MPNDRGLFGKGSIQWKMDGLFSGRPSMNWTGKYYTGILTPSNFTITEGTTRPTSGDGYKAGSPSTIGPQMLSVGGSASNPGGTERRHMKGTTYAFWVYNRALTNEELFLNHKVDEARFRGNMMVTNVLVDVEGDYTPTEAPGAYEVCGTWTFTASPAVDAETGSYLRPRGRVESLAGNNVLANSVDGEVGYTWTDGDPAVKLTWRWAKSGFFIFVR